MNIWDLSDLTTPWCVYVVATLRIADHIHAGIDTIDQLAAKTNCDRYVLHSVLGHLVRKDVFMEPEPGKFALTNVSQELLDPTLQLSLNLEGIGGRFAHAWSTLLKYTRTGNPAYQEVFGLPFWQDLSAHPEIAANFDALIGPAGHGTPNPNFEITGGWDSLKTVVDVGGGTGAMLAETLKIHPAIHGILIDQPETIARSKEIFRAACVEDRVTTVGQSFFDPLPAGEDLYLLRGVINDWPDKEAVEILKRCAEAARPAGKVVILKGVMPDDETKDITIEMVLLGGKLRTVTEFRELSGKAGLEVVAAGKQPSGYFVTECRPI